jgi:hypothetical protein
MAEWRTFDAMWRSAYQRYGLSSNPHLLNQSFDVASFDTDEGPKLRVSALYRDRHDSWQEVVSGNLPPHKIRELHALLTDHLARLDEDTQDGPTPQPE